MAIKKKTRKVAERKKRVQTGATANTAYTFTQEQPSLPLSGIEAQLKFLEGSVNLILDATLQEGRQKTAVSALIEGEFASRLSYIRQLVEPGRWQKFTVNSK